MHQFSIIAKKICVLILAMFLFTLDAHSQSKEEPAHLPLKLNNALSKFTLCLKHPLQTQSIDQIGDVQVLTCGADAPLFYDSQWKMVRRCLTKKTIKESEIEMSPGNQSEVSNYHVTFKCHKIASYYLIFSRDANESYKVIKLGYVMD